MEGWSYQPARDMDKSPVERLRRFPREPDMLVYGIRVCAAALVRAWLRVYHRLTIEGRENLPSDRSFVMVANHASHLDALCLLSALPLRDIHRAYPAAAKDYFFVDAPRVMLSAVVVNALPFDRRVEPHRSLTLCRDLLESQRSILLLFPEGTRTTTGEPAEFKPGVGLIVAGTLHPVVPCHLEGTYQGLPKGRWLPRPSRIRLTIGHPRDYSKLEPTKASALRIAAELREAVRALSRQPGESS